MPGTVRNQAAGEVPWCLASEDGMPHLHLSVRSQHHPSDKAETYVIFHHAGVKLEAQPEWQQPDEEI